MVKFGTYTLPHSLEATVQMTRIIQDRLVPSASVGYRADETAGGQILTVTGAIRDPDYPLRLREITGMADDTARVLDLEDGSAMINAKLGTVEATWTVERGIDCVSYHATFYETS